MKTLRHLLPLLLCASLWSQTTVLPKTTILPKTTVVAGGAVAAPTVTKVGTLNASFGSPYTISLTAAIPVNNIALLICGSANAATYNMVTADSSSNTWTYPTTSTNLSQQYYNSVNNNTMSYSWTVVTTQIASSGHLTFTPSTDNGFACDVFSISGNVTSSPLDQSAGSQATFGTTITSASLTPSTSPEIAIAMFQWNSAATFSSYGNIIGSAATGLDNLVQGAATIGVAFEWRHLTAATAGTATCVISTNETGTVLFFTFKSTS
jgi:hypothetical protein